MHQTRGWSGTPLQGVQEPEYAATRWLLLAVVSAAQFLAAFDLWVVTFALPTLRREFAPAELADVAWILNAYTILLAAFLAPAGRYADSIGRKRAFVVGLSLFGLASLGCAFAPSLAVMIAWRSVQALSAAVVLPTSLGLALPAFPPNQRGTAVGIWAAVGAIAAGSGPVLGGLLIQLSWRWIFLINVPIVVVAVAAASMLLPRDPRVSGAARFDAVGLVLVLAAMSLVCAGLIEASTWPAILIYSMLAVGGCLSGLFIRHARRHPEAVIPPRLFRARRFSVSAFGLFAYYAGFAVNLLGITLLLTEGMHLSVVGAALGMIPGPISAGIASPFSGRVSSRIGVRRTLTLGAALFALAGIWPLLLGRGGVPDYLSAILPSLIFWGIGNALIQPTLFRGADAAPKADLALAAAVLAASRQLGSAFGVAALVAVVGATGISTFDAAWAIVLVSAALTCVTGLRADAPRAAVRRVGWRVLPAERGKAA